MRPRKKLGRIRGDHAVVERETSGPLKGKIRRKHKRRLTRKEFAVYSHAQALAHLLFPENFTKQVASKLSPEPQRTSYSEEVELDEGSQNAIDIFYKDYKKPWKRFQELEQKHENRVRLLRPGVSSASPNTEEARKVKEIIEAGIRPNFMYMNVGFRKHTGKPVFFEVWDIDTVKLETYIARLRDKQQQKAAMALVSELKKELGPGNHFVHN